MGACISRVLARTDGSGGAAARRARTCGCAQRCCCCCGGGHDRSHRAQQPTAPDTIQPSHMHHTHNSHNHPMAVAAVGARAGGSSGSSSRPKPAPSSMAPSAAAGAPGLARLATRTYAEFVWSLCFGLATVAAVSRDCAQLGHHAVALWRARCAWHAARKNNHPSTHTTTTTPPQPTTTTHTRTGTARLRRGARARRLQVAERRAAHRARAAAQARLRGDERRSAKAGMEWRQHEKKSLRFFLRPLRPSPPATYIGSFIAFWCVRVNTTAPRRGVFLLAVHDAPAHPSMAAPPSWRAAHFIRRSISSWF